MNSDIMLWQAGHSLIVPNSATTVDVIVPFAKQLAPRDIKQVIDAYKAGSYEMMSGFIWTKTMAALKRQLESLGMEFVGEMLRRPDITIESSVHEDVTDYEAIRLAEDLGMIRATEAMRLRQCLETILHFGRRDAAEEDDEEMSHEEAVRCARTCVEGILGHPHVEAALLGFVAFRKALESKTFSDADEDIINLKASPYFHQRTVLTVLLTLIKSADGASLEHALANVNTILPAIWEKLRKPERWQTGKIYAEIHSQGKKTAIAGLKKALVKVHGFDFVPETLRSNSFAIAAEKVIQAHEELNNFYNEPAPMRALAEMGTAIPMPAFEQCMTAAICVRLGNTYGCSYGAQEAATALLRGLSKDRWEYFLNECLPSDTRILDKLTSPRPRERWIGLVEEFDLAAFKFENPKVKTLLQATAKKDEERIQSRALELRRSLGYK